MVPSVSWFDCRLEECHIMIILYLSYLRIITSCNTMKKRHTGTHLPFALIFHPMIRNHVPLHKWISFAIFVFLTPQMLKWPCHSKTDRVVIQSLIAVAVSTDIQDTMVCVFFLGFFRSPLWEPTPLKSHIDCLFYRQLRNRCVTSPGNRACLQSAHLALDGIPRRCVYEPA